MNMITNIPQNTDFFIDIYLTFAVWLNVFTTTKVFFFYIFSQFYVSYVSICPL